MIKNKVMERDNRAAKWIEDKIGCPKVNKPFTKVVKDGVASGRNAGEPAGS